MTFEDLKKIPLLQTRTIAEACKDPETYNYIIDCLNRYFKGDYGLIRSEDTQYNNDDLKSGYGHTLARYEGKYKLSGDIYIESHFDKDHLNDIEYTQTMIMYPNER